MLCRTSWRGMVVWGLALAVIVVPMPAAAQAVMLNFDHFGGMLHSTAERPSFAVATIRKSAPNGPSRCCTIRRDSVEIQGTPLQDVIDLAYADADEK